MLDGRYLTDVLRAELARDPSCGVLLETLEVEIRCLRRCLSECEGRVQERITAGPGQACSMSGPEISAGRGCRRGSPAREILLRPAAHLTAGCRYLIPTYDEYEVRTALTTLIVLAIVLTIGFELLSYAGGSVASGLGDEEGPPPETYLIEGAILVSIELLALVVVRKWR